MACRYQLRRTLLNPCSAPAADVISLDQDVLKFGRNPEQVHVVLHSQLYANMISREHAEIRRNRNADGSLAYYLFDPSLNGTYVNDFRVNSSVLLHPGDTVKFGHVNGAAMARGQIAPQPDAEFAYVFEKVPRSAVTPTAAPNMTAQQAAYDAAARRLAAAPSPHAWPPNPYAQLTSPAAAAYLAATGFGHPYLSALPAGLLPTASAAGLSTPANSGTSGACSPYSGVIGGPSTVAVGSHNQSSHFRPPLVAEAAAAWLGAAASNHQNAQTLPVYQQPHHAASATPRFPLDGHAFGGHAASLSMAQTQQQHHITQQHQRQQQAHQFQQQYQQQFLQAQQQQQKHQQQQQLEQTESYRRAVTGANASDAAAAAFMIPTRQQTEIDALSSLALLQKHHNVIATSISGDAHQQLRPSQIPSYGGDAQSGVPLANQTSMTSCSESNRVQLPTETHQQQYAQQASERLRPSHAVVSEMTRQQQARPVLVDLAEDMAGKPNMATHVSQMPVRESVVVETPPVVRTHADAGRPAATPSTGFPVARVKRSSPPVPVSTADAKMCSNDVGLSTSGKTRTPDLSSPPNKSKVATNLQKAECDSSVPSPPEDPIRRKSVRSSSSSTSSSSVDSGTNAAEDAENTSLNHDLLRLAADARSRCLSKSDSTDDVVFDLNSSTDEKISKPPQNQPSSPRTTKITSPAVSEAKSPYQRPTQRPPNKKPRSNEVKRLFDDLAASNFLNANKKRQRRASDSSAASSSASDEEDEEKGKTSSSSDESNNYKSIKESWRDKRRKRSDTVSESSSSSSSADEDSESKDDSSPTRRKSTRVKCKVEEEKTICRRRTRGAGKALPKAPAKPVESPRKSKSNKKASSASPERKVERKTAQVSQSNTKKRGQTNAKKKLSTNTDAQVVKLEDAWNYHIPAQQCAAGTNCCKPDGDELDWVECDDCSEWFHVDCVGCVFDEVKADDAAFHCGCTEKRPGVAK